MGTKKEVSKPEGIEKGNLSWEAYWMVVLRELGGSGKTEDATKYAIKANPKIKDQTLILTSARTKLSKLYREKKIGAIKSNIRSEGYEYILPKESEPNGVEIK